MSENLLKIQELNRLSSIQITKMQLKEKAFEMQLAADDKYAEKLQHRVYILQAQLLEIMENCETMEKQLTKKDEETKKKINFFYNQEIRLKDKFEKMQAHIEVMTKQIIKLNEENLEILKENDFMKKKLRYKENPAAATTTRRTYSTKYLVEQENVNKEDYGNFFFAMRLPTETTTSLKRSGAPIQSKNAGRLPFVGLNSPNLPKSILKESAENLPSLGKRAATGKGIPSIRVQFDD